MGRLAPLRRNLDFMPSPVPDRPGLLIRDPFQFAQGIVIIPSPLLPLLAFFDGEHSRDDLLARIEGAPDGAAEALVDHVERTLSDGGFLEDGTYTRHRAERIRAFRDAAVRPPIHAGGAYPAEGPALEAALDAWMASAPPQPSDPVAIAAPHVSIDGGFRSYAAAYARLSPRGATPTFVILGTSHYGEPHTFALTRKPFGTPFGEAAVDVDLVEAIAAAGGTAVRMEDYTHAVEHSVEFQVLFLQRLFGPSVRIVPVLCGAFGRDGRRYPEDDERIARVFAALGQIAEQRPEVPFVLGVDLAHVGRRYGDAESARADEGALLDVARQDGERLARLRDGDAHGFWDLVRGDGEDPLRWCGSSALYTFAQSVPHGGAELLRYEQWNIDDHSVVTFAGLAFRRRGVPPPKES